MATKKETRHATLYDALEARINKHHATGFLGTGKASQHSRGAATPTQALAARLNCSPSVIPTASAEQEAALPSSDLLDAIHGYTSLVTSCYKSMDETALLAMGILLEESVQDLIGEEGYLMLEEPSIDDEEPVVEHVEEMVNMDAEDEPPTRKRKGIPTRVGGKKRKGKDTI